MHIWYWHWVAPDAHNSVQLWLWVYLHLVHLVAGTSPYSCWPLGVHTHCFRVYLELLELMEMREIVIRTSNAHGMCVLAQFHEIDWVFFGSCFIMLTPFAESSLNQTLYGW